jgi:hypothetical protein
MVHKLAACDTEYVTTAAETIELHNKKLAWYFANVK